MKTIFVWMAGFVALAGAETPMFDGKSLTGWEVRAGEEKWWTVADGVIRGGSLEEKVTHNTFLATTKRYANFDLRLKVRLVKGEGFMNSGVQVRSIRVPDNHEMSGYQVDAGIGWWGKLYDESRRNKVVGEPVDPEAVKTAAKDWDWNEFRILCEGPRIRSWINGVAALDYAEKDASIPLEGRIGLQTHGGGKFLVEFKDVTITELPATPGAKAWPVESPMSPEEQQACFTVPEGFEVELVASEEQGVGKPVTVAWDPGGRMWTMTAFEYPVDANENEAHAEVLFASGGRDKVLVFDDPYGPGPHVPRAFADRLAIPLGILPLRNGAIVQHGHEIRFYEDKNGDRKADGFRTVLEGFGIQDSHLFPHQFERAPGNWVYVAQGLYNHSDVKRPGGVPFADGRNSVIYSQCKLARFKSDGSNFELLCAGPDNIWGLVTARNGEVFVQESNDRGIPVAEFVAGVHYNSSSQEKLKPYAPELPPSFPDAKDRMGGTGLCGLAIAEDEGSPFAEGTSGRMAIYVANPVTSRIQVVSFERDANGHPVYRRETDFMTATDSWFRPVAVRFGPDGCLYVVDWYNKVISHNEVSRTHPDRDKTRGRIWRIKPKGMSPVRPPDLTKLAPKELLGQLGGPNALVARMAWQELGDRGDRSVVPVLETLASDRSLALAKRLGALWALEEMGALTPAWLVQNAGDPDPHFRYEVVRAAGDLPLDEASYVSLGQAGEKDFRVRCAWANALRRQAKATAAMVRVLVHDIDAPAADDGRAAYETNFRRYLVRWALETHPDATLAALADAETWPNEARFLAVLALPEDQAAPAMLPLIPLLKRPLDKNELGLLGSQLAQPAVAKTFGDLLSNPASRQPMLEALLKLDPSAAANPDLQKAVESATDAMAKANPETMPLLVSLARRFRLSGLAPAIPGAIEKGTVDLADGLRAMNEIGAPESELCRKYLDSENADVASAALIGFASTGGPARVEEIAKRWAVMSTPMRHFAIDAMLSNKAMAEAFATLAAKGEFKDFGGAALEKVRAVLGNESPQLQELLESMEGLLVPVLRLTGKPNGAILTGISLEGPFTIEAWVRLDENIGAEDSLIGMRQGPEPIDFNFHSARLRVFDGTRDQISAWRPVEAGVWTHVAVTRDAENDLAIYLDGERDPAMGNKLIGSFSGLNIGEAMNNGGSAASYLEVRHWDVARTPEEILTEYRTVFSDKERPAHLVGRWSGDSEGLKFRGSAQIERTAVFPELRTPAESAARVAKFTRIKALAAKPGDMARGKMLAQASCMICHQINGEGIVIGPDLSGAGAMGVDALLNNILYPNDKLESGYYRHDVTLNDGTLFSGFLAAEDGQQLTLRPIGADVRVIPKALISNHIISKRSLMPEGLIDGYNEQQVTDLFAYLMTLK